jgi:hypothetical protein
MMRYMRNLECNQIEDLFEVLHFFRYLPPIDLATNMQMNKFHVRNPHHVRKTF